MLRDHLVCGINHQVKLRRLLAEKSWTFDKALKISLAVEAADKDMKQIQKPPVNGNIHYQGHSRGQKSVRMNAQPHSSRQSTTCHRCLGEHTPQTCPFRQTECHKCKKVGHIAKACKTRSPHTEKSHKQTKAMNYMEETQDTTRQGIPSQDSDNFYDLFTLSSNGQEPILVSVTLNQTPIQMELDTGALLFLLNKQSFDIIANKNHTTLKTIDVHLKTYTGKAVEILGYSYLW